MSITSVTTEPYELVEYTTRDGERVIEAQAGGVKIAVGFERKHTTIPTFWVVVLSALAVPDDIDSGSGGFTVYNPEDALAAVQAMAALYVAPRRVGV